MRSIQKEQERERRRIRDRQRRQSMSVEEREKHLARRRRNYQLRRFRAENSRVSSTVNVNNITSNVLTSVALEIPADKFAKLPARLRLNHLKHLARSRYHDQRNASSEPIIEGNETQNHIVNANSNSTCVTAKCGLRLNRVKRLARSLTSDLEMSTNQKKVEHDEDNLINGEIHQLQLLSVTSNVSSVVDQPYLEGKEVAKDPLLQKAETASESPVEAKNEIKTISFLKMLTGGSDALIMKKAQAPNA